MHTAFAVLLVCLAGSVLGGGPLRNFGTGVSNGKITDEEQTLLNYTLSDTGEVSPCACSQ